MSVGGLHSLRIPAPPHNFGVSQDFLEPLSESGVPFPLTPSLSLGERGDHAPRWDKSGRSVISNDGQRGTLSPRERDGVRGNRFTYLPEPHLSPPRSDCEQSVNNLEQLRFDSGNPRRIIPRMPNQASPDIAVPSPHNWRTTDEDEINRRRARARTEEFRISNADPRHPIFSNFRVQSGSGLTYAVEIRDVRQRQCACECVDFRINGLGTCKHVEAVLLYLQARFKRLFKAAETDGTPRLDVVPDPDGDSIRLLGGNGSLPHAIKAWFDTDGTLRKGLPEEAIEALKQLEADEAAGVRLSQELGPWLEGRRRASERKLLRRGYELKVQSGEWPARDQSPALSLPARGHAAPGLHRARAAGG